MSCSSQIRRWCDPCSPSEKNQAIWAKKTGINTLGWSKLFTHKVISANRKQEEVRVCVYEVELKGNSTELKRIRAVNVSGRLLHSLWTACDGVVCGSGGKFVRDERKSPFLHFSVASWDLWVLWAQFSIWIHTKDINQNILASAASIWSYSFDYVSFRVLTKVLEDQGKESSDQIISTHMRPAELTPLTLSNHQLLTVHLSHPFFSPSSLMNVNFHLKPPYHLSALLFPSPL